MGLRALIPVLAIIVAMSAYDIVRAATVRCVRPSDERRVVALREMDPLSGRIDFAVARVPRTVASKNVLTIHGVAGDVEHHRRVAAVFAIVDNERVFPASYGADGNRFSVPIALAPGPHGVRFEVVASDLTGYYEPETRVTVVAR